jgi:hypothetical protein
VRLGRGDRVVLAVLAGTLGLLAVTALAAELADREVAFFTREPSAALQFDTCSAASCAYVGLLSNLAALVWAAGATACFLAAALAPPGRARALLLAAGALTTLLLADDMFQLHEQVWGLVLPGDERIVLLAYGVLAALFVVAFRRELTAQPRPILLLVAAAAFALSLAADVLGRGGHLVEDGAKLLGTVAWVAFLVGVALAHLRAADARHP